MEIKNPKATVSRSFTLTNEVLAMLKYLAERHSSSMSYEIRRLVKNDYERKAAKDNRQERDS